jgi:hypothetical protein
MQSNQELAIEQRLTILEAEVAGLKRRLDAICSKKNWIDRIAGSMKDEPEFGEVLRLGAALRQADRPSD